MKVGPNKLVTVEYIVKLDNGQTIDTNVGKDPLTYVHGIDHIMPGLEKGLVGMEKGETKVIIIPPEEGYGYHDEKSMKEVAIDMVPEDARKVGSMLYNKDKDGRSVHTTVSEIKEKTVVLDFNHPMAGQTVKFKVKVLGVHDVPQEKKKEFVF